MKTKHILIIVILFVGISCSFIYNKKENKELKEDTKNLTTYAFMIETGENTNSYVLSNQTEWQSENYEFNSDKSYCTNGTKPSMDQNGNVTVSNITKPTGCYLYFDRIS